MRLPVAPANLHVMAKPIGPICNLDCSYCYYLEKEHLHASSEKWAMPPHVLERYIRDRIEAQPTRDVSFMWQGGEPTLLGVDFFREVVRLQRQFARGKRIANAIQTNGTLLDDAWCEFLKQNNFLVGVSIDGPRELHDVYRVDKRQKPTFDLVVRAIELLKRHTVEFCTLTVVNRRNSTRPLEVYNFLKEIGSRFVQFIPLVERVSAGRAVQLGMTFALAPTAGRPLECETPVTEWSVLPDDFGQFLSAIFDEWIQKDVGRIAVQMFEIAVGRELGKGPGLCYFAETCGNAIVVEHNGDVYSCDHYVYPEYRIGNVMDHSLAEIVNNPQQLQFGTDKRDTLPAYCRNCEVRFACNGDCPKHRFTTTPDGEPGLSYLCSGYKHFFKHIDPKIKAIAALIRSGRPAPEIMRPQ